MLPVFEKTARHEKQLYLSQVRASRVTCWPSGERRAPALRDGGGTEPNTLWDLQVPWPSTAEGMQVLSYADWVRVSWKPPLTGIPNANPDSDYFSFGKTKPWFGDAWPTDSLKAALEVSAHLQMHMHHARAIYIMLA